jgi:hypothetical protein
MAKDDPTFGGSGTIAKAITAGKNPNADLDTSAVDTKAQMAVALKLSGASYTEIARVAGYSDGKQARLAVERVLANSADSPEAIEQLRVIQDKRYSRLLQSVMGKAVDPKDPEHLAYNARALAIIDRMSKLHGVDAPQQIQITPTDDAIRVFVEKLVPQANQDNASMEADIFDAVIVGEDGEPER